MTEFERMLVVEINKIRHALNEVNIPDMRLDIEVSGRVNGDLKVEYILGEIGYSNNNVRSGSLDTALDEYLHRIGFARRHQALCLPNASSELTEDSDE